MHSNKVHLKNIYTKPSGKLTQVSYNLMLLQIYFKVTTEESKYICFHFE